MNKTHGGHGGKVDQVARELGIDKDDVLDFSANINPLALPEAARKAIASAVDSIKDYPDDESIELIEELARYHDIPAENLLVGNGSIEFIYLIARMLRDKRVLIIVPAFSEYERALKIAGADIEFFYLNEADDFRVNTEDLTEKLNEGFDALWMANPANPNGGLLKKAAMEDILAITEGLNVLTVIDEAFMDFCEDESIKTSVLDSKNLIVLRSMTKFFALAGLRVGYIFAPKEIIVRLRDIKEPWTLNRLGSVAAIASLKSDDYIEETCAFIADERDFMYEGLKALSNIKTYTPSANFILIGLTGTLKAEEVQRKLLKSHILIRDCTNYRGLTGEFIRVAIKKRAENIALLTALKEVIV